MSGDNTSVGGGEAATTAVARFTAEERHRFGVGVFDEHGEPFVLIPDEEGPAVAMARAAALVRLLNGMGWDGVLLLAEAASRFRQCEAIYRAQLDCYQNDAESLKLPVTIQQLTEDAEREAEIAGRIEAWLQGGDPVAMHPVEALRDVATHMAGQLGLEVDHAAFDRARRHLDEIVPPDGAHLWTRETKEDRLARAIARMDGWVLPAARVHIRAATGDALAIRYLKRARDALRPFPEPAGGRDPVAAAAVAEALGPDGPGPFTPSFRPVGGSTRPVVHSEEAAIDARASDMGQGSFEQSLGEDPPQPLQLAPCGHHPIAPGYEPDAGGRPVHVGFVRRPPAEGLECTGKAAWEAPAVRQLRADDAGGGHGHFPDGHHHRS